MSSSEPTTPLSQNRQHLSGSTLSTTPSANLITNNGNYPRVRPSSTNDTPRCQPTVETQLPPNEGSGTRAPLPEDATLLQLLNISLKNPDYGVVNYRSLYVLLEYLLNRLNVGQERVDLRDRVSREAIREATGRIVQQLPVQQTATQQTAASNYFISDSVNPKIAVSFNNFASTDLLTVDNSKNLAVERRPYDGLEVPHTQPFISPLLDKERIANLEKMVATLRSMIDPTFVVSSVVSGFDKTGAGTRVRDPDFRLISDAASGFGGTGVADGLSGADIERFGGYGGQSGIVVAGAGAGLARQESKIDVYAKVPTAGQTSGFSPLQQSFDDGVSLNVTSAGETLDSNYVTSALGAEWAAQTRSMKAALEAAEAKPFSEEIKATLLVQRLNASEQAMEKTMQTLDNILRDLDDLKNIKQSLQEYIQKLMLNPTEALVEALRGKISGMESYGSNLTEQQCADLLQKQVEFVKWSDLRAALVESQTEDEDRSTQSPEILSLIAKLTDEYSSHDAATLLYKQTGGDKTGKSSKTSSRSASESEASEKESKRAPRLYHNNAATIKRSLKMTDNGAHNTGSTPIVPGTTVIDDVGGAVKGSQVPLVLSGEKSVNSDVFHSLMQLGQLIKGSKRFEIRLARIEGALGGLLNRNEFNRMSDILRSDIEKVRKGLGGTPSGSASPEDQADQCGGSTGQHDSRVRPNSGSLGSSGSRPSLRSIQKRTSRDRDDYVHESQKTDPDNVFSPIDDPTANQQIQLSELSPVSLLEQARSPEVQTPTVQEKRLLSPLATPVQALVLQGERFATLDQVRGLRDIVDIQRHDWERMKANLNAIHTELTTINAKIKEQTGKAQHANAKTLVQPQFEQFKTDRTVMAVTGPSRSEFEIFCRACGENFEMIEIRLNDLEHLIDANKQKLEELQFQTTKLQHDKADTDYIKSVIAQKADISQLNEKVDQRRFEEFTNQLHEKLVKLNGDLHEQGDYLHENMKIIVQQLQNQANSQDYDNQIQERDKAINAVLQRVTTIEKRFQIDDAAGSKKPIRSFTCISCDKPVDPTPNEYFNLPSHREACQCMCYSKPAGWPHAYLTLSIRPHLSYMKNRAISASGYRSKSGELRYRNRVLGRQLQRYIREQECTEFKATSQHFADTVFPHCNHGEFRPVGGKHTQLGSYVNSPRNNLSAKSMKGRVDAFAKDNSLSIQFPRCTKSLSWELPGYPDMSVSKKASPRKPANCKRGKSQGGRDLRELRPGLLRNRKEEVKKEKAAIAIPFLSQPLPTLLPGVSRFETVSTAIEFDVTNEF